MKIINSSPKPFFLSFLIILLFCSCQLYAKQTKPKRSKRYPKLAATAQPLATETQAFAADTLIYNNTTNWDDYYYFAPGTYGYSEILDYGTSVGGNVTRFIFRYYASLFNPGTITIRFYSGTTYSTYPGTLLKTFTFSSLSGSGWHTNDYAIPAANQFVLPSGAFGYSYEFTNSSTGASTTSGGSGSESYFFLRSGSSWLRTSFSGGTDTGVYMKLYIGPALDKCSIEGCKFNDTDGNGVWDPNEPGLQGWEIYLDLNDSGQLDPGEPNTITGTDPNGFYRFSDLDAGTYIVAEVARPGWTQTNPGGDGTYTIIAEEGMTYDENHFGNTSGTVAKYCDGTGTEEDPYLICTPRQMNTIGVDPCDWDKHFILANDIDMSGYSGSSFNLIGTDTVLSGGAGFTGVFNGDGHTISNFEYDSPFTDYVALFRGVDGGQIKNLVLDNVHIDAAYCSASLVAVLTHDAVVENCRVDGGTVDGRDMTGGLLGYISSGASITDCSANVTVSGWDNVGGFIGFNSTDGYIARCFSTGDVTAAEYGGGFVGSTRENIIEQCYATGNVDVTEHLAGGFCGSMSDYAKVNDCYATGDVEGYDLVGNFVGSNHSYTARVQRSYATGSVSGSGYYVHGFAGRYYPDCYTGGSCFFNTDTSGVTTPCFGNPKTTIEMYQKDTYLQDDFYISAAWDFEYPIWTIEEGVGYPKLWWETYYASDDYGDGTGRLGDPFLIDNAEQMNAIGTNPLDWNKHFKLMADIDLSGYTAQQFNLIGLWSVYPAAFTGTFDGNGHTISNFSYDYDGVNQRDIGIFSRIDHPDAEVKDLTLIDPGVDGGNNGTDIGSLIGQLDSGTVTNCRVEGGFVSTINFHVGGLIGEVSADGIASQCSALSVNVTSTTSSAGGLVGVNYGTLSNCRAECSVTGIHNVGGLVGYSQGDGAMVEYCSSAGSVLGDQLVGGLLGENSALVTKCFSTATINTTGTFQTDIGGLVGRNINGQIDNSYAIADVNGGNDCGGLVGLNAYSNTPTTIDNCYAASMVSGTVLLGGLVGRNIDGVITNSFWDIDVDGHDNGLGTPQSTSSMQSQITFVSAGWDFNTESANGNDDTWCIAEGVDYPKICVLEGVRYGGGFGTCADPYQIYTAYHMNQIGLNTDDFDKNFKLMEDIDLSAYTGTQFNLIGFYVSYNDPANAPFGGGFDGNGHTISNFTYTSSSTNYIGLFGYVAGSGTPATIRDLTLTGVNINAGSGDYVGALAGRFNGIVANCSAAGSVTGDMRVGGLVGYNYGWLYDCSSTGTVAGNEAIGGLIGDIYIGQLFNCYSTASVTGGIRAGGLVGNSSMFPFNIVNCYAAGPVSGTADVGGLTGYVGQGIYTDCFWDSTVNPGLSGIGNITDPNVTGLSTTDLQTQSTFTNAGWDFVAETINGPDDDWGMPTGGGYPVSWWQLDSLPPLGQLFSGGTGTSGDPYLISTAEQLNSIGHNPLLMDKHFKLTADIDLTDVDYYMIGGHSSQFAGVFDGDSHAVSNLTLIAFPFGNWLGFSQVIAPEGHIKNLEMLSHDLGTSSMLCGWVGSLTALNHGTIDNCFANGAVTGYSFAGGIAGMNYHGTIADCRSTGSVTGENITGGLTGQNLRGFIHTSSSAADVDGDWLVGGLVGENLGTVSDCYVEGTVSGSSSTGGLIGANNGIPGDNPTVSNCYVSGAVINEGTSSRVASFIGVNLLGTVSKCFFDSEVNPTLPGMGLTTDSDIMEPEVVGQTTAQMQTESTFTDAGWDFVGEDTNGTNDIWRMCVDDIDYPHLPWKYSINGDFACPDGVGTDDLLSLSHNWLNSEELDSGFSYACDPTFDGVTNLADYVVLAENWLEGTE